MTNFPRLWMSFGAVRSKRKDEVAQGRWFNLDGSVIAAMTNSQNFVSLSSMEAEYVALAEDVKTIVWLRNELLELGVHKDS